MATTLEIITGIHQAAANAYDGAHDERFVDGDDLAKKVGLRREEGCPIIDSRVIDGFNVKIAGNQLTIIYHTEFTAKQASNSDTAGDVEQSIADILKFLKKEYKKVTGDSLSLKKPSEIDIQMQPISRLRVSTCGYQSFEIGNIDAEDNSPASEDRVDKAIKDFLAMGREQAKKPSNYTAKNES